MRAAITSTLADKVAIVAGASKGIGAAIAPAVVFLASADASWITGETLPIAGGLR